MTTTVITFEIVRRCAELQRLQQANRRKTSRVRMRHAKDGGDDVYSFEIVNGVALRSLPQEEIIRLDAAREVVKRRLAQFQAEIGFFARAHNLEDTFQMFYHYGNERTGTLRTGTKAGNAPAPLKSPIDMHFFERLYFETFDDGRSVWTVPSNWKKRGI